MKTCPKCGKTKSLDDFHKRSAAKDGRQTSCKLCNNKGAKQWQRDNAERYREGWKKRFSGPAYNMRRKAIKYGLTLDELKAMYEVSDGKCQICKREDVELVVDHCHNSLKVRGLICNKCNTGIGLFKDNAKALRAAANYLDMLH